MKKTQIQLPDTLYDRARRFAHEKEMSLAEVTRRSLETYLDRFPTKPEKEWRLQIVDAGGPVRATAADLKKALDAEVLRAGLGKRK